MALSNHGVIWVVSTLGVSVLCFRVAAAQACLMERSSITAGGLGGNGYSRVPALSWDGRFVAFSSAASNLVPNDANGQLDVFVHDRTTSAMELISVSSSGVQANDWSSLPCVPGDGRYVTFRSAAGNLDPSDTSPGPDVYLRDRMSGTTVLVSHRLAPGTSPYGAWISSTSQDGRFVAFDCFDDNLVPGDQNGWADVYVRDMQTGSMELVSVGNQGELGDEHSGEPSISGDGRYVAFGSRSSVWFPGNPNKNPHIYVRDRLLVQTILVSNAPTGGYGPFGGGGSPAISADGSRVAFMYLSHDILPSLGHKWVSWEIFVRDLSTQELTHVSPAFHGGLANHESLFPKLSGDGRFVVWESYASNLVPHPGDINQDIFWRDLETGVTVLVSRGLNGAKPNGWSVDPAISYDGRTVAFASQASNLVPGDAGFIVDIFVRSCDVPSPTVYCQGILGASGCAPVMSFQGSPSASTGSGFLLCGDQLVGGQTALVLYSTGGSEAHRLLGGYLCMELPVHRASQIPTNGTPTACDGSIVFDMNAWIASGTDPQLAAGMAAYSQIWCRDPADPFGGVLSDAVAFLIEP